MPPVLIAPNHRLHRIGSVVAEGLQKHVHQPLKIHLKIRIFFVQISKVGRFDILPFVVASIGREAIALVTVGWVKQGIRADKGVEPKIAAELVDVAAVEHEVLFGVVNGNFVACKALPFDFGIAGVEIEGLGQNVALQIAVVDAQFIVDGGELKIDGNICRIMREVEGDESRVSQDDFCAATKGKTFV